MPSSIANRKLKVVELITKLENEQLLDYIELLLQQPDSKEDWGSHLSDKEKANINTGLNDLKSGRLMSYEEFKKKMSKRYP